MTEIISAVYKIINTITGDFYIGSSNNVKRRWTAHKCHSTWNKCPNNPIYLDMKKYGTNKFDFQVIAEVKPESLKEAEQRFIELLKPTYNNYNANGLDAKRYKEYHRKYNKKYDKQRECQKKYDNQLCRYNSEILTLCALSARFRRAGIEHPTIEARKYLV